MSGWRAKMALMLMMLPPPRASISGTAARAVRIMAISLTSNSLCHWSSLRLASVPDSDVAALLTSTSTPPKRVLACASRRSMSSAWPTSA